MRWIPLLLVVSACWSERAALGLRPVSRLEHRATVRLSVVDGRVVSGPLLLKPFESVLTDDPLTILDNRLEVALANRGVAVRSEAGATIDVTLLDAWWVLARPEVRVTTFVRLRVSCLGGDAPLELVLATSDRDLDLIDSSPQRQVTSFEAAFTELAEKVALACAP